MPFDKVWVLAEASAEGKPTTITYELLTKARQIGTTVEAVAWGEGVDGYAADLGRFGATKVLNVGDLGGSLPGVPVAAALAAQITGGNKPDAILFPQSYDGRDVAGRLSAKLNLGVLTNLVGLGEDGTTEHAIFGGATIVKAKLTNETPY
ncbi:MAG: electron transfer flavoprotein subunit alpha/FixB family protein, partial [Actinomycetota bacterium]|nr:electron transfer flavoprotein subunit alpha/FixB family protein [Actinomycetota bacterium]